MALVQITPEVKLGQERKKHISKLSNIYHMSGAGTHEPQFGFRTGTGVN